MVDRTKLIESMLSEVYPYSDTNAKANRQPAVISAVDPNEEENKCELVHEKDQEELDEGVVSDLLVKLKIIDPDKFINAIFNAVEKKVKGIEKKARVDTTGKKVIDVGTAISYVGKKGGDVNLSEIGQSVKDLQRASTAFTQKYENLTNAIQSSAGKYIELETAKNTLTMLMAVGQIADIITALNKRVEDTTKNIEIEAHVKGDQKPKEQDQDKKDQDQKQQAKEPEQQQAKPEPITDPEVKKVATVAQKVDPQKIEKALDDDVDKAIDNAAQKVVGKMPNRLKPKKQYEDAEDEIADAIGLITMFTNFDEDQATDLVDNIIIYGKVDLKDKKNLTQDIFYKILGAIDPKNITDPTLRNGMEADLSDVQDEYEKSANESKRIRKNVLNIIEECMTEKDFENVLFNKRK